MVLLSDSKLYSLLAYGFPQFAVEGAESVDAVAVVLFQAGLHKLQELWLLCVVCQERGKRHVTVREKKFI